MKTLQMVAGCALFAVGTVWFAIPNLITAGGLTGFSTLLHYRFGWNTGFSLFLLNIPLFLLAWRTNKHLFVQSIGSGVLCFALIGFFEPLGPEHGYPEPWIGSVIGGLVMGFGLGLLGLANASLGGGTLLGKLLNHRFSLPFGLATFIVDITVYPFSFFVIGLPNTLYSVLLAFCSFLGIMLAERAAKMYTFQVHPKMKAE